MMHGAYSVKLSQDYEALCQQVCVDTVPGMQQGISIQVQENSIQYSKYY